MAVINYSVSPRRNPQEKGTPPKYYAKVQASGTVSFDTLASEISYASTLTDGDVSNVLRALVVQIKKHLADGKIVSLDGFGSFQFQLSSKGALTEKDYRTSLIKKMRIQFKPGRLIREVLNLETLSFQKVKTRKSVSMMDEEPEEGDDMGDEGNE